MIHRIFAILLLSLSTFNSKAFTCTHSRLHYRGDTYISRYTSPLQSAVSSATTTDQENLIKSLFEQTREESDGTKLPSSQRDAINAIVQSLEDITKQEEDPEFTLTPLEGEHRLIYIDSERTPQYIGPFKGTTTQYFIDDEKFENRLSLGPIQIALSALRQRMDGLRMKVKFQSFAVKVFGNEIVKKELKQQGVWKMVFVGEVDDVGDPQKKILLRVMRTPSLYILAKDL